MRRLSPIHGLIVVLLVTTILRIPNLFEPYWYGDEGIYLTLGHAVRRGLTLYRDIHDNKPPLLYLVAAVAHTEFWFKFILLGWHLATAVVFSRLVVFLFPKRRWAPVLLTAIFSLLTLLPEGNIANGEIFMILPVVVAMTFIWMIQGVKKPTSPSRYGLALLSGVGFSLGFLFKVPVAFDFAAAFVFLVALSATSFPDALRRFAKPETLLLVLGFSVPILSTIIYYAGQGALEPYLRSALLQNVGYLGSWSAGTHDPAVTATRSGLPLRTAILGILIGLLWVGSLKFRLSPRCRFTVAWFLFALYGALLSERPYPHYLIQPAVPASLLVGLILFEKRKREYATVLGIGALGILSYFRIGFWQYPILSYYENFWNWALERQSTSAYFSYFGDQVNRTYQLARYVLTTTGPDDRIFVWGDEPNVYALSGRLPPGRYTVAYHVADFRGWDETVEAIRNRQPRVIIIMPDEARPFESLTPVLQTSYIRVGQIQGATIYRRLLGK